MTIYAKIRIYYPYWRILEIGLYFLFRTYLPDRRGSSYCDLVSDLLNITAWSYCYSEVVPCSLMRGGMYLLVLGVAPVWCQQPIHPDIVSLAPLLFLVHDELG
uniref:Uncharacterized protein n=1 Tax=Opuntia streptacantha TaxID=393608 RepID=A0A7C9AG39_OPUST